MSGSENEGTEQQDNSVNEQTKREELAHKMYDAYCEAVGGKAFNGDPLPPASEFFADESKQKQADGWRVASDIATAYFA